MELTPTRLHWAGSSKGQGSSGTYEQLGSGYLDDIPDMDGSGGADSKTEKFGITQMPRPY